MPKSCKFDYTVIKLLCKTCGDVKILTISLLKENCVGIRCKWICAHFILYIFPIFECRPDNQLLVNVCNIHFLSFNMPPLNMLILGKFGDLFLGYQIFPSIFYIYTFPEIHNGFLEILGPITYVFPWSSFRKKNYDNIIFLFRQIVTLILAFHKCNNPHTVYVYNVCVIRCMIYTDNIYILT